jgi:PAS domain S-box-containing protein
MDRDPAGSPTPVCLDPGCGSLLDVVNDAIFVHDPASGAVLDVNRAAEEMFEASRGEICDAGIEALSQGAPPYSLREAIAYFRAAAAGAPQRFEWQARTFTGRLFWVDVNLKAVRVGGTDRLVAVVRDVTARRQAEDALRESDQRFRMLAAAMPQIVCVLRPDGEAEYVSPAWVEYSGMGLGATRGAGWLRVLHPDDLQAARDCRLRALKRQRPQDVELRYRAVDGTFRWFLSRLAPIVEGGRVVRLVGAAMDIEESKRAAQALGDANERLREADRRKTEFLAMLSHELRNPLAPIRNALYILEHAAPAGDAARRAKEVASRQIGHVTRLVDDLLDVTRIARGKIELRCADLDLAGVARRTADDYRALMSDRGLALDVDVPAAPVVVHGDATRLAQVLGNLLSNAAKFTPPGGRVSLSLQVEDGRAVIHVRDTGSGIAPEVLPTLFEPFTQARQTIARSEGGLGLGLSLVKGLVALHGGDVAAASEGGERGTDLVVRLPLAPRTERAPPAREAARVAPAPEPAPAPSRRVLVIDDNHDAADSVAELVKLLGHAAIVAYDAFAGLAKAAECAPDVVLCDIGLPGMDGYEFARRLRASPDHRAVRLVAVSGYAQPEDVARALEAGFDAHVAKPPDPLRIEQLVGAGA